jgi:hypothetical protein
VIRSYQDYRHWIRRELEALQPTERVSFCSWCLGRFPEDFGAEVWDGLTDEERSRLKDLISELRSAAAAGVPLSPGRAAALQREVETFGPLDEAAAIEVHPNGVELRSAVWQALELCKNADVAAACAVSEAFINSWDYRVEQQDDSYGLENMFTFPELKREIDRQQEYIDTLNESGRRTRG